VQVANDARELERARKEKKTQDEFFKRLEVNKEECKKECDIINSQWPMILALNDPLEINSVMESQAKQCERVLNKKNAIIAELKEELDRADNIYFDDQSKQKDDIKLLLERIENQVKNILYTMCNDMALRIYNIIYFIHFPFCCIVLARVFKI
jgi:vacuolar-type H+-ATPase subunit I/STV1